MIFPYLLSKLAYLKQFEIFKMAEILRSGRTFKPVVLPEVESYIEKAMPLPIFWAFDRRSS